MPEAAEANLVDEIDRAVASAKARGEKFDPRREIVENVYPLLRMIAEGAGGVLVDHEQRLDSLEGELEALGQESVLEPELATRIDECLRLGLEVCAAATPAPALASADLQKKIALYKGAVAELRVELAEITIVEDDDNEGNGAADDEDEE